MARGFVSGVVWGLVVSGAGVAGASLLAGDGSRVVLAPMAEPEKPVVEAPVAEAPAVAPEVVEPQTSEPEMQTPDAVAEPEAVTPDPVKAPEPETPAEEPQTAPVDTTQNDATDGASEAAMSDEQQAPAAEPVEEAEAAAPVEEQAVAAAPQTPVAEAEETVETVTPEVTTPTEPEVVEPDMAEVAQPAETPVSEDPAPAPEMSEAMSEDPAPQNTPQEDPAPEVAEAPVAKPAAPKVEPATPKVSTLPQITAPEVSAEAETDAQTESPEADTAPADETAAANTSRLPTIGGPSGTDPEASDQDTAGPTDQGALEAYAMPFENPDAKPMLSVVLIDDPDSPLSAEALVNLPFPLSFAIDATREDASEVAARYRDAGFEVMLLTNLPNGASASDVEVSFEAYINAVPEAVAVLDRDATAVEAQQIAGILSDRGFGLVTPSKGLNSAQKAAQREGVPAALIYRELDGGNEEVPAIRQYLDRAAFRAAQEGSVIMLGHTRPETIKALVLWALEGRAASVAIAPVSAVLKGG